MTFTIPKSQTFPGFDVAVAAFAKEMRDWREQEKTATEHDRKTDIDPKDRWVHRKRPSADPWVMQAVNENGDADFEIVDDGPSNEQILKSKKSRLMIAVSEAEKDAVSLVVPAGKHRLLTIREGDILAADHARRMDMAANYKPPSILKKISVAVGFSDPPPDIEAEVLKQRPQADVEFLSHRSDCSKKIEQINRAVAQMQSDIEDLTLDNIDAWKMPDFPK